MKNMKIIGIIVMVISVIAAIATLAGILTNSGPGEHSFMTFRGEEIKLYGKGIYKDMSADVAIQGIAQDYVTLILGVPILIGGFISAARGSLRGRIVMTGALGYFFLTYLFYTAMAMYNELFLGYVILMSASFFGLILGIIGFEPEKVEKSTKSQKLIKIGAVFLIINGAMVMLLWLGTLVPPLLNGKVYPQGISHYTTMIVQGFDLGLFLPMAFVSAILAIRNHPYGRIFVMIYTVFLSLLMSALSSKIAFMANAGANVIPVVFIMPTINIIAIIFSILNLINIKSIKK